MVWGMNKIHADIQALYVCHLRVNLFSVWKKYKNIKTAAQLKAQTLDNVNYESLWKGGCKQKKTFWCVRCVETWGVQYGSIHDPTHTPPLHVHPPTLMVCSNFWSWWCGDFLVCPLVGQTELNFSNSPKSEITICLLPLPTWHGK